jgi:hypothetical protein
MQFIDPKGSFLTSWSEWARQSASLTVADTPCRSSGCFDNKNQPCRPASVDGPGPDHAVGCLGKDSF